MRIEAAPIRRAKYKILLWLRVEQRCAFIVTEGGPFNADCLGVAEKKMVEVEIKHTLVDLKNDFKKGKHTSYIRKYDFGWDQQWVPTHFYFAVPFSLLEKAKEYLETKEDAENYGIISIGEQEVVVVKRAKWLHKREPNSHVKFKIGLRMGSELIRFHEAWL